MKKKTYIILSIFLIFVILLVLDIYKCPIKLLFGLSCPLCGITRAFLSAFKLDFSKAFYYHLLWPFILIGLIIHVLYEFKIIKLNKKIIYIFLYTFSIINLIYYFYRLFSGSDIIYFDFTKSLIYKIFKLIV